MNKQYKPEIALAMNTRGVWCLDTSVGCSSGMAESRGGCYGDCYAAKAAKLYGYDFSKTVLRHFKNPLHVRDVVRRINGIDSPFVRIGCSGDPSEDWVHCLSILKLIRYCNREIVIITRHWNLLTDKQVEFLSGLNVCVNTSVSALDAPHVIEKSVSQFKRLRPHLKSFLRIVSCSFNIENERGHRLHKIQAGLFKHGDTIDTVFRPSASNPLVTSGVIKVAKVFFNGHKTLASKFNERTFTGKCGACQEQCGATVNTGISYANRPGIIKQTKFKFTNQKQQPL